MGKVRNEKEKLLWFYDTKRLLAEIDQAIKNYHKKWRKPPTKIAFKEGVVVEYEGDLDVVFIKNLPKQHFLLGE
jgi:hypothetical protein